MKIIFHNDDLSLNFTWHDYLQIDSEGFILFAETNQTFLKIYIILTILTFMYLVAIYQITRTQLIIVTDNCNNNLHIFQTK